MPTTGPSEQEMAALYERYAHVVFHRARSIVGSEEEANDAVQETFARVITHWDSFRGEASPLTWMYRITTNWCLNQLRNRHAHADKHRVHRHDIMGEGVTWLRSTEDAELVRRLLAECDEQTRRIVVHLFFDDMTREQVAEEVGISVPTLRKRVDHFLRHARRVVTLPRAAVVAILLLLIGGLS